jgi:hypothetical protein
MVHVIGIALLALGLAVSDLRSSRPRFAAVKRAGLREAGWTLVVVGLGMKVLALYLWGIRSLSEYLGQLYAYDVSVRTFGFLDQGVAIAIFGFVCLACAERRRWGRQAAFLLLAFAVAALLSTSKTGINLLAPPMLVLSLTLNRELLRRWSRPVVLVPALLVFVVGLGVKTQVKYFGLGKVDVDPAVVWEVATNTVAGRFSGSGLYSQYSFMINRLLDDPTRGLHGRASVNMVAGVLPRFVWETVLQRAKPAHPFYARGDLLNEGQLVDLNGNDAPTLVGEAFADANFWSLIPVMFCGGVFSGLLRRWWLRRPSLIAWLGYAYFTASFGTSFAETGYLSVLYFAALGLAISGLLWTVRFARRMSQPALPKLQLQEL